MGFIKGGSWGSCEPPKTPWLRVCVGANLAYAMTLFAFDSVILIIVNTRYHNVDPAFLVYYVPGIFAYIFKLSFNIIWQIFPYPFVCTTYLSSIFVSHARLVYVINCSLLQP